MIRTYKQLWNLLLLNERKQVFILFLLMIVYGAIEVFGIISLFPLIAVLTNISIIESNKYLSFIYEYFNFQSIDKFLIFLTSLVFIVTVTRTILNGFVSHSILRFTQIRNHSLSTRLLHAYLKRPYIYFLSRHSADMGKTILSEVESVIYGSYVPSLEIISKSLISIFVLTTIFIAEPKVATISFLIFTTSYGLLYLLLRKYLYRKAIERIEANKNRYMIAQEALVGIKEIKVRDAISIYLKNFDKAAGLFHKLKVKTSLIKLIPQLFIQISTTSAILIVILVLLTQVNGNYNDVIPLVAIYALAGMRILPAIQGIFKNLTSMRSGQPYLSMLYKELIETNNQSLNSSGEQINSLDKEILLKNISFSYPESKSSTIENISLTIPAKSCVAFVGSTGAGKSTTIDLLLGLLEPTKGFIKIDGINLSNSNVKGWQKIIGYVPQSIFIADDSISNNIALGSKDSKIDFKRIKHAAKLANLDKFINNDLPFRYETKVGEAGVKLSGGQKQRLGIARALYLNPKVLIFDEATSALDNITEKEIMNSINSLKQKMTIILVAHRLTTVKECDNIFYLEKGNLKNQGTFQELINKDANFERMASKIYKKNL
tara:strand:+ start:192 stop:2000 length:1809 start_codon:yes stop_codon:yes gene_type:complete